MQTQHDIHFSDAREMDEVDDEAVELVVTSPPYPMIEMWDKLFAEMNADISECLSDANSDDAFEHMHRELDAVWSEVQRVLCPGGIACINIGDATRKVGDTFQLFPNHVRISQAFQDRGFDVLPSVLWRKPTNKGNKFMGSGMLPPNAYVTLEHEYILIFRNGSESRGFESNDDRRYESAYFWEERNQWYSDVWTEIAGERQNLLDGDTRNRSAAYPFELPYRLINMFSLQGDTVLDPFWGTGTTSIAAMTAARNSIGYELDDGFNDVFEQRVDRVPALTEQVNCDRLAAHKDFIQERETEPDYESAEYDTSVVTKQEKRLRLWNVKNIVQEEHADVQTSVFEQQSPEENAAQYSFTVEHEPFSEEKEKEKKKKEEAVGL